MTVVSMTMCCVWLVDWLADRWIDWLAGWLIDWLVDWLVDWQTGWLIDFCGLSLQDDGTWTQLWLVTQYMELGSLFDFLTLR